MIRIFALVLLLAATPALSQVTDAEIKAKDVVSRMAPADPTCMTNNFGGTFRDFAPRRGGWSNVDLARHHNRLFRISARDVTKGRYTIWRRCLYVLTRNAEGVRVFRSLRRVDPEAWANIEAARTLRAAKTGRTR